LFENNTNITEDSDEDIPVGSKKNENVINLGNGGKAKNKKKFWMEL